MKINILFEGFLHNYHSYAIVNYFFLKYLLRTKKYNVYYKPVKFFNNNTNFNDKYLKLKEYKDQKIDLVIRSAYPYNCDTNGLKTLVFYTQEFQFKPEEFNRSIEDMTRDDNLFLFTPSTKSKNVFADYPVLLKKVFILNHGVDTSIFKHNGYKRKPGSFRFLNVSAMSQNKNIEYLLSAFFLILKKYKFAKLVLKINTKIYKNNFFVYLEKLKISRDDMKLLIDNIIINDAELSFKDMNWLYNSCDCYVSASTQFEAFDIPRFEASAAGLPVICAENAVYSSEFSTRFKTIDEGLFPDIMSLYECMESAILGDIKIKQNIMNWQFIIEGFEAMILDSILM